MKRKYLPAAFGILLAGVLVGGCANGELHMQLKGDVQVPSHRVLVFFVDGLRADTTTRMLAEGRLPNIQKYLYDRGCHTNYAVSVFPSITYASIASMMTGKYPGHHEIMGNEWFDRNTGQYRDYIAMKTYQTIDTDLRARTIFEVLPDKYTVSIQTANRRGVTRPFDNWMSNGIAWYFQRYSLVDRVVAQRFDEIAAEARLTGRWPDYIYAYFPSVDHQGHTYGSISKQYEDAIINVDEQIGRICRGLERDGLLDDYYLILISDHGHVYAEKQAYWQPKDFLKKDLQLPFIARPFLEDKNPPVWQAYLQKYRVVLTDGGPRQASFHLRTGDHWHQTPTFDEVRHFLERYAPEAYERMGRRDLIELLVQNPTIRIVVAREDTGRVRIFTADGEGRVERRLRPDGAKVYRYEPLRGDPLGYRKCPTTAAMVGNDYYDSETWLHASDCSEFPDFVPQVVEMEDSPRAGQISVYAAEGWDFSERDYGGHGSVLAKDMFVPFVVAGPGIKPGHCLTSARVVDLMPTVLDMLGCRDRLEALGPIDGVSRLPQLTGKASSQPALLTK